MTLFTIIFLTVGFRGSSQSVKEVEKCYVYQHQYKFGVPAKEGTLIEIRFYKNDRLVKKQYVNQFKRKRDYVLYKYNKSGKVLTETGFSRRKRKVLMKVYKYTNFGKPASLKIFNSRGKLTEKTVWEYLNGKTYFHKKTIYDSHGIRKSTVVEKSNEHGQRMAGSLYGRKHKKILGFEVKETDSLGNETLIEFTKPEGEHYKTVTKQYDAQNRLVYEFQEGQKKIKYFYKNNRLKKEVNYNVLTDEPIMLRRYVYLTDKKSNRNSN
ncbi:MAG: hypothetical protein U9N85_07595 [Bacteroidota bacterium]|nr:hypothetical protein [Bacteroidota bacterium]